MRPTEEEMTQALIARVGEDLPHKFKASTVAICGLGDLGSNIAISLARAGVGTLILIDFDRVGHAFDLQGQFKSSPFSLRRLP